MTAIFNFFEKEDVFPSSVAIVPSYPVGPGPVQKTLRVALTNAPSSVSLLRDPFMSYSTNQEIQILGSNSNRLFCITVKRYLTLQDFIAQGKKN